MLLVLPLWGIMAASMDTSRSVVSATSNPWLARRPLVIAHQGGAYEGPSNTLYAFKRAMRNGVDMLEFDVHLTADGQLVVIHDDTVDRTTGSAGFVRDLTLEHLKALDAAFCWRPDGADGCDASVMPGEYPLRGVATGHRQAPEGFGAADFRIPTLQEVLEAVQAVERDQGRDVYLIFEIKYNPDATAHPPALPFEGRVADVLATPAYGRSADNTIVAATLDDVVERFRAAAARKGATFSMGAPERAVASFLASSAAPLRGAPKPLYQVLAVPTRDPATGQVVIDDGGAFVHDAHVNGFAVHAWTINDREEMIHLLLLGVDGIITDRPSLAREVIGPNRPHDRSAP
ncbi:MAG TPA: glycerophosphodiester phosphodiesterase family protein [Actinomycetota bacterium]|jgi:glycerophosphoryl diester phosphodiesterase